MGGYHKDLRGLAGSTSKVEGTSPCREIKLGCGEFDVQGDDWSKYERMADSTLSPKFLLASPPVLFSRVQRGPLPRHHSRNILLLALSYSTYDESY